MARLIYAALACGALFMAVDFGAKTVAREWTPLHLRMVAALTFVICVLFFLIAEAHLKIAS